MEKLHYYIGSSIQLAQHWLALNLNISDKSIAWAQFRGSFKLCGTVLLHADMKHPKNRNTYIILLSICRGLREIEEYPACMVELGPCSKGTYFKQAATFQISRSCISFNCFDHHVAYTDFRLYSPLDKYYHLCATLKLSIICSLRIG